MYSLDVKSQTEPVVSIIFKQQNLCCEKDKTKINQKVSLYC